MNFKGRLKSREWANEVYNVWSVLENSEVEVYLPEAKVYDPQAKKNIVKHGDVFWSGWARVQTIHIPRRDYLDAYDRVAQRYQFQIAPYVDGITDSMVARVISTELNADLLTYEFNITEFFNSDGAFETTFFAEVNSAR